MKSGKRIFKLSRSQWISVAVLGSSLGLALAVTVPNTFTAGTPASATQVNDNFTALVGAVTTAEGQIASTTTALTAAQAQITTNFGWLPRVQNLGGNSGTLIAGTDLGASATILSDLTVTAPGDGVILALWSGWVRCAGAEEDEIRLFVNGLGTELFNVEECTTAADDRSVSAHYVHAVTSATSYAFQMRGRDFNGIPNNITLNDSRLTLLFLPFGFNGQTATPAAVATSTRTAPVNPSASGHGE